MKYLLPYLHMQLTISSLVLTKVHLTKVTIGLERNGFERQAVQQFGCAAVVWLGVGPDAGQSWSGAGRRRPGPLVCLPAPLPTQHNTNYQVVERICSPHYCRPARRNQSADILTITGASRRKLNFFQKVHKQVDKFCPNIWSGS